jgi:hypothetical protein
MCKLLWSDGLMNDVGAPDLLDGLLDLSPRERYEAVATVCLRVWETPNVLLGEIPPTQAVTAVAVVAAGLPGAYGKPWVDRRPAPRDSGTGRACPVRAGRDRRP